MYVVGLRSRPIRSLVTSGLRLLVTLVAVGCGDDTVHAATEGATESGSHGVTDSETIGGDTTSGRTDSSGTEGDSTSDDDTGEPAMPGRTVTQIVATGQRSVSSRFTMIYTLGQPTSLSSTHVSSNYSMQGGLIGANASTP